MDVFKTAEDILNEKGSDILSVSPDSTLAEAITVMTKHRVGAILVKDQEDYVGIWTERDLLNTLLPRKIVPEKEVIRNHMQTKLVYAQHDDIIFHLIDMFLGLRLRHLLIQRDGRCIGVLSSGDVMRAALQQRTLELERMRDLVKLKYYDQWAGRRKS